MYLLILIDVLLHARGARIRKTHTHTHTHTHNNNNYQCKICWNKALTFGVGSIQLSFRIYHCFHPIYANMFSIQMLLHFSQIVPRVCTLVLSLTLGAHARGLQYSFCLCVCLSVCLSVCFPYSGTSRNLAYKQQYKRLQRDTGMKYKKGFFFKTLRSEVMASFTHLE